MRHLSCGNGGDKIIIFFSVIWLLTANCGPLSRGQPQSTDVDPFVYQLSIQSSLGSLQWGWVPKPTLVLSGDWTGTPDSYATPSPTRPLSPID